jgi:hypothetical protein
VYNGLPIAMENIVEQVAVEDRRERLAKALDIRSAEIFTEPIVAEIEARRILKVKVIDRGR